MGKDGAKWTGGLPFLTGKSGKEIIANPALGGNRHDQNINAINGTIIDKTVILSEVSICLHKQLSGICNPTITDAIKDKTKYKHLLKYSSVWFSEPEELRGLTLRNVFKDQNKFPELYSFNPKTKRMTKLANSRRLNELIRALVFHYQMRMGLEIQWLVGALKIVYNGPFLVSTQHNWRPDLPNWDLPVTGGLKGQSYYLEKATYTEYYRNRCDLH